jgi:polysaccharide biosynthesis/export protein
MRPAIVLLLALLCAPHPRASAQAPDYQIGKGDQLLITVWGFPEFTTSATVRDDGAVGMPLVGDVPAAGQRKEEFTASLRRKLAEYVQGEIKITVSVLASSSQRVSVLGAVTRPDTYPISGETSVLEVIGMAGGFSPEANLSRVQVFRKDAARPTSILDVESALERADVDRLPPVRPGDVVFVPRAKNFLKDFAEYMGYVVVFFAFVTIAGGGN